MFVMELYQKKLFQFDLLLVTSATSPKQKQFNIAILLDYLWKQHIKIQRDNFKVQLESSREGGKQSK